MKAKVYVTLKKGVLDPQGKAVLGALGSMGFSEAEGVRIGKVIELELSGDGLSREEADERVRQMCDKILANPVMEDYTVEFVD